MQNNITFHDLGLSPEMLAVLDTLGYSTPTPIQCQSIPVGMQKQDVIGIAQTGTGKTLAFGIPLVERARSEGVFGLILLPTRELALQVDETLQKIGKKFGIRTAVLIGGASMGRQIDMIHRDPHFVIATPGRLIDHLTEATIKLTGVSMLVLDEADRMLDMGFWPQIKQILATVPRERQTSVFSATLSREIRDLATGQMRSPVHIEVAPQGTTAENVTQEFFVVPRQDKARLLEALLSLHTGSIIVFTRTKHAAKRLTKMVNVMGHKAAEIHGNRTLNQRTEALSGFKTGKYRVLIATDIAARGIDVKGVDFVINFDMPEAKEDYVHRIGRTARAGADGHAITFVEHHERREIAFIERLIRRSIPQSQLPELPPARAISQEHEEDRGVTRNRRSERGGGRNRNQHRLHRYSHSFRSRY